jgi:hypothetical protein
MQRFMIIPPRDPGATRQRAGGLGLFFSYDLSAGEVPVGYLDRDTDLNRGAGEPVLSQVLSSLVSALSSPKAISYQFDQDDSDRKYRENGTRENHHRSPGRRRR